MTSTPELERNLRPLTEAEAEVYIAAACFRTGTVGAVGLELERIVHDAHDPERQVPVAEVRAAMQGIEVLPDGGSISYEPGGQLEVSTACAPDLPALLAATRADLAVVGSLIAEAGLTFSPLAMDSVRPPVRSLHLPRYAAMEEYFNRLGPAGRAMMCSTASLQICVDAGLDGDGDGSAAQRWSRLHQLAPVLVALFANSPFRYGAPSGWRSTRQAVWSRIDHSRSGPVPNSVSPPESWMRYAMDAFVLCIRNDNGSWDAPPQLRMRDWLRGAGPRPVTLRDLEYHLTTLFPHVRPRGFLELRVIDAQPADGWEAASVITAALIEDQRASDCAAGACAELARLPDPMDTAAREAMANPTLAAAASTSVSAALDGLERMGIDKAARAKAEAFAEEYTWRGRCPADERLRLWQQTGSM
ncbi:glutamate--cysteine ligase family protein [Arthrobacter pigmenti]